MSPKEPPTSYDPGTHVVGQRERGFAIFNAGGIRGSTRTKIWHVPSATVAGAAYTVRCALGRWVCNCPRFVGTQTPCKHIAAVGFLLDGAPPARETTDARAPKPKRRNWQRYNKAKATAEGSVARLLRNLVAVIEDPPARKGHQPAPLAELVFTSAMRVYVNESGRDYWWNVQRRWVDEAYLARAYHFNTISQFLRKPIARSILLELVRESASPLAELHRAKRCAVDSTGFQTTTMCTWYDAKYGGARKREYLKLHVAVDVETHVITNAVITNQSGADTIELPGLLRDNLDRYCPGEVTADKAYAGKPNYDAIASIGAKAFIPPRGNMTGAGNAAMRQTFEAFRNEDPDVLRSYHQRSNVETVMFMIKRQFSGMLLARSTIARENEILLRVLCHNLHCLVMAFAEFGTEPRFFAKSTPRDRDS